MLFTAELYVFSTKKVCYLSFKVKSKVVWGCNHLFIYCR